MEQYPSDEAEMAKSFKLQQRLTNNNTSAELTLSAMFAYDWSRLYQTLRRAEAQLAETIWPRPVQRNFPAGGAAAN